MAATQLPGLAAWRRPPFSSSFAMNLPGYRNIASRLGADAYENGEIKGANMQFTNTPCYSNGLVVL